jgi:protein gp37
MEICALPHARWSPALPAGSRRPTLADIFGERVLGDPLDLAAQWREPHHVFTCRRYDLFEQPAEFIDEVFGAMIAAPQHEYQISTSRSARLLELDRHLPWRPNIWMGVRVASERDFARIDDLRASRARVKFVEVLPSDDLLGSPDLSGMQFALVERGAPVVTQTILSAGQRSGCKVFVGPAATARERTPPQALAGAGAARVLPPRTRR